MRSESGWRIAFGVSAATLLAGGPLHPDGTMAEMLAHPEWFLSHILQLVSYGAMALGLWMFDSAVASPPSTRRWLRLAIAGTILQTIEMVFHTWAMVDHRHLVAGEPTPVLTTHLALAVVAYPIFALTAIGFVVAAARDRVLGTRWLAPVGVIGLLAHGLAAPLVVTLEIEAARILFPMVMLAALWLIVVAVMPRRAVGRAA
jgi:hypothetical protein